MILKQQEEQTEEIVEKFKEQLRDENFILRLEQLEGDSIYALFEAFEQYDQIYR